MGSRSISSWRRQWPDQTRGKTGAQVAAEMGRKEGYGVVLRYKSSPGGDYDTFGTCHNESMVAGYFSSEYCHDTEVLYVGTWAQGWLRSAKRR